MESSSTDSAIRPKTKVAVAWHGSENAPRSCLIDRLKLPGNWVRKHLSQGGSEADRAKLITPRVRFCTKNPETQSRFPLRLKVPPWRPHFPLLLVTKGGFTAEPSIYTIIVHFWQPTSAGWRLKRCSDCSRFWKERHLMYVGVDLVNWATHGV